MNIKILIFACLLFITKISGQIDSIKIIENKLDIDLANLNILKVEKYSCKEDVTIHNNVSLQRDNNRRNYAYDIYFLKSNDSITLLRVVEFETTTTGVLGRLRSETSEKIILNFHDLRTLANSPTNYNKLLKIVDENKYVSTLEISGGNFLENYTDTSPNENYLSFTRTNDFYSEKIISGSNSDVLSSDTSGINPDTSGTSSSEATGRTKKTELPWYTPKTIDVSFSRIVGQISILEKLIGSFGISFEISTNEKVINSLPFQNNLINFGARSLWIIPKSDNDTTYIDARAFLRAPINWGVDPFNQITEQKLNIRSFVAADITLTRLFWDLPNINIFFAYKEKDFENPYKIFKGENFDYGFFSQIQIQAKLSFYWNLSSARYHRFRMDLGAGYYDVWKAEYEKNEHEKEVKSTLIQYKTIPLVELYYDFFPDNNPDGLMGVNIRFFDAQFNFSSWLKLIKFNKNIIRLEVRYLSPVSFREEREWENSGGAILQLRYRYRF